MSGFITLRFLIVVLIDNLFIFLYTSTQYDSRQKSYRKERRKRKRERGEEERESE